MFKYLSYRLGQFFVFISPRWLSYKVGRWIGRLCYLFPTDAKEAVRSNVAHILDYERGRDDGPARRKLVNRIARETFENFTVHIIDFFDISNFGVHGRLEKAGMEKLDVILEAGRGVIAITAHIGNWELGPKVLSDMGYKFGAVEIVHKNKRLDRFFTDLRVNSGALMAHEGFEIRHMMKILKQNGLAAFVVDRDVSRNGRKVKFFGEETTLVRGASEFSCKTGIPIIPGFMIQLRDGEFKLMFDDPISVDGDMDREERLEAIYARVARALEKVITRYPSQWFMFYKIWPKSEQKKAGGKRVKG